MTSSDAAPLIARRELFGAVLRLYGAEECRPYLSWIAGEGPAPADGSRYRWLLAHSDSGVTWGVNREGHWALSIGRFAGVSPLTAAAAFGERLQQLRLFSPIQELLIWRTDGGPLGRVLADSTTAADAVFRPLDGEQVLIGDRLLAGPVDGFTLVGDATGSRHAVPVSGLTNESFRDGARNPYWPLRLKLRQYLEQDSASGAVRIAAARLIDVAVRPAGEESRP
jgi:CRISPR-associated protein (TIGR03984 family)